MLQKAKQIAAATEQLAQKIPFTFDHQQLLELTDDLHDEIAAWNKSELYEQFVQLPEVNHAVGIWLLSRATVLYLIDAAKSGSLTVTEHDGNTFFGIETAENVFMLPAAAFVGWLYNNISSAAVAASQLPDVDKEWREIFFTMVSNIAIDDENHLRDETVRMMLESLIEGSECLIAGRIEMPTVH